MDIFRKQVGIRIWVVPEIALKMCELASLAVLTSVGRCMVRLALGQLVARCHVWFFSQLVCPVGEGALISIGASAVREILTEFCLSFRLEANLRLLGLFLLILNRICQVGDCDEYIFGRRRQTCWHKRKSISIKCLLLRLLVGVHTVRGGHFLMVGFCLIKTVTSTATR